MSAAAGPGDGPGVGDDTTNLRRAPFAENPRVGQRGLRAQRRILDAALRVFDEVGYHQTGVIRITEVAGCSRASFYQYFSSKEDVFRHLAGDVARQLMACTEALPELTADTAGWTTLRHWIDEHTAIHARYAPVFQAFQAAAASDVAVARLDTLLEAAHDVLVTHGYHATRVDDIAAAAGISHGAFYRYFDNKDHIVRAVAIRAIRNVSTAFAEMPDIASPEGPLSSTSLRRWLRRYASTQASEAAMIRVWVDGAADDPLQSLESAAALDWGRGRLVQFLEPRGFGDVDTEALLLVVLLDALGAQRRSPAAIEAAAPFIERGLLGSAHSG